MIGLAFVLVLSLCFELISRGWGGSGSGLAFEFRLRCSVWNSDPAQIIGGMSRVV